MPMLGGRGILDDVGEDVPALPVPLLAPPPPPPPSLTNSVPRRPSESTLWAETDIGEDGIGASRGDSGAILMLAVCMVSADATEAMLGISGIWSSSAPLGGIAAAAFLLLSGDDVALLPLLPPALSQDILMQYSFSRPFLVLVADLPDAPVDTTADANRLVTGCRSRAVNSDTPTCRSRTLSEYCPAAME